MGSLQIEYTDTFGGEANYSWVRRATVPFRAAGSDREAMRLAKATMGLTGARGRTYKQADYMEFRPYRSATVLFVVYSPEAA